MDSNSNIKKVQEKVDNIRGIMHENISQALVNLESTKELEIKSEDLMQSASIFKDRSTELKRKMCWKEWKMKLIIGGSIFLILGVIIVIILGVNGTYKK